MKKMDISQKKGLISVQEMEKKISVLPSPRSILRTIGQHAPMGLIAEIKRASPSAGTIREDVDPCRMAQAYDRGGACAISVLTETHFFRGDLSSLGLVRGQTVLPVLQKDFILDPFQIYEGRASGADAILLITALLDREELKDFVDLSKSLGLVPLVEVHDEEDLEKTGSLDLPLIGINNRNLKTFDVDLKTTLRLRKEIPSAIKVVSESGIKGSQDVRFLKEAGADAILVGELLMRSQDPALMIRELLDR